MVGEKDLGRGAGSMEAPAQLWDVEAGSAGQAG